jgi:ATP-dependent 26S proteasome regulatory subunit
MARLSINVDHVEAASLAIDKVKSTRRGELDWEWTLAKQCPAYWACIERLLMGSSKLSTEVRILLTYVYHAVCTSLQGYPNMREDHWKEVLGYYPTDGDPQAAMNVHERGYQLMQSTSGWWCEQFESMVSTNLVNQDVRLVRLVWCAVVVLLARARDEPFKLFPPEERSRDIDASFRSVGEEVKKKDVPKAFTTLLTPVKSLVSFDDIGGLHAAKHELIHLAARINQPSVGKRWGSRPVHAVLLKGPKGTGKTTLAHALAAAVHLPFFKLKVSDVLSVWVNHSAMLLADIFKQIRAGGGGLLFLDEADAIIVKRGSASGHNEDDKVVNQWNQCVDDLTVDDRLLVVLATNFEGKMDDAAIRDGRVDLVINVPAPATDLERREIFKACMARAELRAGEAIFGENIQLSLLARNADGMTGAVIENVINIALRAKEDADLAGRQPGLVTTEDLQQALVQRLRERPLEDRESIGFQVSPAPTSSEAGAVTATKVLP